MNLVMVGNVGLEVLLLISKLGMMEKICKIHSLISKEIVFYNYVKMVVNSSSKMIKVIV